MALNIFISILTSILTSLAVWRFYINWQYHQSTAAQRASMVIDAMFYLIEYKENTSQLLMDNLNSTYRSSLGPICRYLEEAYKGGESDNTHIPRIAGTSDATRWQMYDTHVRPVLTDINNNSFIGWLPGVPNVERLLTLQLLCFQLEKMVASIDLVLKRELGDFLKPKDTFVYSISRRDDFDDSSMPLEVVQLVQTSQRLEVLWLKWKELVLQHKEKKRQAA